MGVERLGGWGGGGDRVGGWMGVELGVQVHVRVESGVEVKAQVNLRELVKLIARFEGGTCSGCHKCHDSHWHELQQRT